MLHLFFALQALLSPRLWRFTLLIAACSAMLLLFLAGFATVLIVPLTWLNMPVLDGMINLFGTIGVWVLAWWMLPLLIPALLMVFLSPVIQGLEQIKGKTYPSNPAGLLIIMQMAVALMGKALLLNILCWPLYLIPVVNILFYILLNGWLIGRGVLEGILQYYHADSATIHHYRMALFKPACYMGCIVAMMGLLPIINLVTPILACAMLASLYWQYRKNEQPHGQITPS